MRKELVSLMWCFILALIISIGTLPYKYAFGVTVQWIVMVPLWIVSGLGLRVVNKMIEENKEERV